MLPDLHILAPIVAERLLNTALEGVLLAGVVWLSLRVVSRQNSGTRFAVWLLALAAVVALPFVSGWGLGFLQSGVLVPANSRAGINLSSSWANYLLATWGVGAGLSLLALSVGLWRVRQIRRRCCEVDLDALNPATAGILHGFKSRRQVKLCVSTEVTAPAAIGFFRPAIVFPAGLLSQLSAEEIRVILLHELAHLRRFDDWTNLGQKVVKAIFFFHPAVWWIENRLTLEREMACDDIVLAQTASPRAYASSLISFAEKLRFARGLALAQSLLSRVCQMSLRVAHILDARQPTRTRLWKPILGASTGLMVLVLGAAPYTPRIVAFKSQSPSPQAATVRSEQLAKRDAPLDVTAGSRDRASMGNITLPHQAAPQPRAIQAAFNPRKAIQPLPLKSLAHKPAVIRARAVREEVPIEPFALQDTFVILQTTRFDGAGSGVWTLCVWRVVGNNARESRWESAIVLSVI